MTSADGPAQLHVMVHEAGPRWQPGVDFREQPGVRDHLGFMRRLLDEGRLVMGGPYLDGVEGLPVGMAIVRGASADEAERLANEDPSIASGLLRVRVRPWLAAMRSFDD